MSVYLMRDEPTGYYKIGRSYSPVARERTLLAQAPQIVLWSHWDCEDSQERFLHATFAKERTRGEWFVLADRDVKRLYWLMQG